MLGGCLKFSVAFVIAFIVTVSLVFGALLILGKCAGPPSPEQQLIRYWE